MNSYKNVLYLVKILNKYKVGFYKALKKLIIIKRDYKNSMMSNNKI